jgi:hypothetical protein
MGLATKTPSATGFSCAAPNYDQTTAVRQWPRLQDMRPLT